MEKELEMKSETMSIQLMEMDEAAANHAAYRKVTFLIKSNKILKFIELSFISKFYYKKLLYDALICLVTLICILINLFNILQIKILDRIYFII